MKANCIINTTIFNLIIIFWNMVDRSNRFMLHLFSCKLKNIWNIENIYVQTTNYISKNNNWNNYMLIKPTLRDTNKDLSHFSTSKPHVSVSLQILNTDELIRSYGIEPATILYIANKSMLRSESWVRINLIMISYYQIHFG